MFKKIIAIAILFLIIVGHNIKAQSNKKILNDNTIIYEVNVRQYTPEGTFAAFAKSLPRLKTMGINTVWFMPINPIGIEKRKQGLGSYYSVKDYKAINPEFGNLQDFKNVVQKAHQLGMKVMIDWVANHTAWDNAWVTQHPEYYKKDSTGKMFGPFDWSDVAQLDYNSKGLQIAMQDAMAYWVKSCDIDGFRCDVAELVPLDFWIDTRKKLDKIKPLMWLAEAEKDEYFQAFDAQYGWKLLHAMNDYYKGKVSIDTIKNVINNYGADYNNGKYRILFTSNHDENSWNGTEQELFGNMKTVFAKACEHWPGVPLIYSGQENDLNKKLRFFEKDTIDFSNLKNEKFYSDLFKNKTFDAKLLKTGYYHDLKNNKPEAVISFVKLNSNQQKSKLYIINLTNQNISNYKIVQNAKGQSSNFYKIPDTLLPFETIIVAH
jgi:alpha-amylase